MKPLTPKQQRFVAEYLVDLNATQAARRCGYSPKTADREGYRLLRKAEILAAIQRQQARNVEKASLTADRVLEEYRRLGFSNVQDLLDAHGNLRPIHELPAEVAASIASLEVIMKNATAGDGKVDRVLKVKFWDKTRALNDLARHFALLVDRIEVSGEVTLGEKIAAARQRGAQLLAERNSAGSR